MKAVLLLLVLLPTQLLAQEQLLTVGVVGEAPFVLRSVEGEYSGLSVAIWKEVAQKAGLSYRFISLGINVDEALKTLQSSKVDVLVGPVAVTSERAKLYSFSRPFYINKLAVIDSYQKESFVNIIFTILGTFAQAAFFIYLILIIIFTTLHWYYECRRQGEALTWKTYLESLYMVSVGLFTLGYPEFPKSPGARIISVFCVLLGIGFALVFSASVTTAMTISSSDIKLSDTNFNTEALNKPLLVVEGSFAKYIMKAHQKEVIATADFETGMGLMLNFKHDAFVENYLTVKYLWKQEYGKKLAYNKLNLGSSEMAFAYMRGSPLVSKVDESLTYLQDHNMLGRVCSIYMSSQDVEDCFI